MLSQSNINRVYIDQNLCCLSQTLTEFVQTRICCVSVKHRRGGGWGWGWGGYALRIVFMNKILRFTNTLLLLLKVSLSAIPHHTTAPAHHSNSMSQTSQSLNSYLIRRMIKAQIKAIRVRIANCSRQPEDSWNI